MWETQYYCSTGYYIISFYAGSITVLCLIWKAGMTIMLSWLQIQQRENLGTVAAESFIPALGPCDMMSVSCVDLSHSITYVIDKGRSGYCGC